MFRYIQLQEEYIKDEQRFVFTESFTADHIADQRKGA